MSKRLFVARYTGTVYFAAEDFAEARRKARACIRDEFSHGSGEPDAFEVDVVTHVDEIAGKWRGALAWGCDEDTKVEALVPRPPAQPDEGEGGA